MAAAWLVEYRYRKLFHLSHEEYMAEPMGAVRWMVHIDALHRAAEKKQADKARS